VHFSNLHLVLGRGRPRSRACQGRSGACPHLRWQAQGLAPQPPEGLALRAAAAAAPACCCRSRRAQPAAGAWRAAAHRGCCPPPPDCAGLTPPLRLREHAVWSSAEAKVLLYLLSWQQTARSVDVDSERGARGARHGRGHYEHILALQRYSTHQETIVGEHDKATAPGCCTTMP
jgi:hypothetical protein